MLFQTEHLELFKAKIGPSSTSEVKTLFYCEVNTCFSNWSSCIIKILMWKLRKAAI